MEKQAPLVLVDGSSYLYRAFHALPPLNTRSGQPTGAIKGVINMVRRLQKDYPGSSIVVVFDAKGKTFRDEIYPQYKANRPSMPDDLRQQIAPLHEIVEAMGLPLLSITGVEADDVIGTLASQAERASLPVVISTGDKDMAQLVSEQVSLVNTMTDTLLDPAGVIEKFGIGAEFIIDYLALMGDKVDNIPGVAGVGEKTALGLIQSLGGIDDIYRQLDRVVDVPVRGAKKLAEKLADNEEQARLSYRLATIKCDVALPVDAVALAAGGSVDTPAEKKLAVLFAELEFNSWSRQLEEGGFFLAASGGDLSVSSGKPSASSEEAAQPKPALKERDYDLVLDQKSLSLWMEKLSQQTVFAVDTETTSLDYMAAKIVGVSVALASGEAAYIPCGHDYLGAPEQLDLESVLAAIKPLLECAAPEKVGQNLKYDKHVLANHGVDLQGIADDSMLQSYVFNATATRHNMDALASFYLGCETTSYESVAGKGAKQLPFNQVELAQAAPYAAEDADISWQLCQHLATRLAEQPLLQALYRELELPLLDVLCRVERNGVLIDGDLLRQQSAALGERLVALESQAHELAGETFNLASPKQLQAILFDKLKLPVIKKTPKGQPSTAEPVLQELALDFPLPQVIMEYRGLSKLKSTYTDRLPEQTNALTGRVHTSYHQAVTATGRLSSSDPNLQNIPIRSTEGRRIREAFIAPSGCSLIAADYSQIELRIMAHLSEDKGLLEAFAEGRDIHTATAAEVFGTSLEKVTADQRRSAKAINFGLIYGMSAWGLARQLRIDRSQAQTYIDRYFDRYPGVARYMDRIRTQAAEDGFVETVMGRRLYLPEIHSQNRNRRQGAERTAINAPMQGTAADIIKQAMIDVDAWLAEGEFDALMVMQVHDELVFEVAEAQVERFIEQVQARMQAAASLSVPLIVEAQSGANWDEAH